MLLRRMVVKETSCRSVIAEKIPVARKDSCKGEWLLRTAVAKENGC